MRDQQTIVELKSVQREFLKIVVRRFRENRIDQLQAVGGQHDLDISANRTQDCADRLLDRAGMLVRLGLFKEQEAVLKRQKLEAHSQKRVNPVS